MADSFEGAKELVERGDELSMRIALLSYRSKTHCGGQGVYLRHLSTAWWNSVTTSRCFPGSRIPTYSTPVSGSPKFRALISIGSPTPFGCRGRAKFAT